VGGITKCDAEAWRFGGELGAMLRDQAVRAFSWAMFLEPRSLWNNVPFRLQILSTRCEPLQRSGFGVWGETDDWILAMQNHIVSIDHIHSRAICDEVADRLRIILPNDLADAPGSLKSQIRRLQGLDQSPSIVPSIGRQRFS
jgi:hypothetical protein